MDIRHILDIVTENSQRVNEKQQLLGEMEVMSLDQFLEKSGVEPATQSEADDSLSEDDDDQSDMAKWMRIYVENEDENRHSENVVHLAKLVGSERDVKKAEAIRDEHDKIGYMTEELLDARSEIHNRLYPKMIRKLEAWKKQHDASVEPEVDLEEEKLGGTFAAPLDDEQASAYFDRIMAKDKDKRDKYKLPYVHRSNIIPIVNDEGRKYDLPKLMAQISERPKKILKQNEKMQHSDGSVSAFYNVGLPALRGLAVDEEKGQFVVINTCPGAGECKLYCYALKGGYVQWKGVSMSQSRLLNWLYNDPDGFMAQLDSEISSLKTRGAKKDTQIVIRWHDAGDFFSPQYLEKAYALASRHPEVDFYAYTKIASVAQAERPDNFKINFSMGAKRSEEKHIDFDKTKNSRVVPTTMFNDLIAKDGNKLVKDEKGRMQFKSKQDLETFKQRLAAKYSVDVDTILTYDEMMDTPKSKEKNKYNVIVVPGDGDDSANRLDVLNTFLLFH